MGEGNEFVVNLASGATEARKHNTNGSYDSTSCVNNIYFWVSAHLGGCFVFHSHSSKRVRKVLIAFLSSMRSLYYEEGVKPP